MKTIKETVLLCFLISPILFPSLVSSQTPSKPKPVPKDAPLFARWLVNQSTWGVLSTVGRFGAPFGNVMSFSDGGTGVPYFYLTFYDPTTKYALKNSQSSFTLSEYSVGSCGTADPQSPICAKITLSGWLRSIAKKSKEAAFAEAALFAAHPQFGGFPKSNNSFSLFKLMVKEIFLVNDYAPAKSVSVKLYNNSTI